MKAALNPPCQRITLDKIPLCQITAQFCAATHIKCRKVQVHSLKRVAAGRTEYWPVVLACRQSGTCCELMADLCFHCTPMVGHMLLDCARRCDACAEECSQIADPWLSDLAHACRETARACRYLARTLLPRQRSKESARDSAAWARSTPTVARARRRTSRAVISRHTARRSAV